MEFLDLSLGSRKAFSTAAAKGFAVMELTPSDDKATQEVKALFDYILAIANNK